MNLFLKKSFSKLFIPPPRFKISEWAEANAYLPAEGNSEPGKFRLARMPWQRDMLDDPIDPNITESAWMLASQLGKTMCIVLIIQYFCCYRPTKLLICYPKLDDVKDFINDKLIPATLDTPAMEGVIKDPRAKGSNSRALNRKFAGGGLVGVGSISTSSLRRVSARVIIQDEIDDFEITPQGDSMALADKRATTFHNAVKLKSSTPTAKDESRIEAKYELGDQQKYFVPCHACGHMQHLEHGSFKFSFTKEEYEAVKNPAAFVGFKFSTVAGDVRDTEKAVFVCGSPGCSVAWTDQQRIASINSGDEENPPVIINGKEHRAEWRAKYPGRRIRSRHMNGYYRLIGRKDAFKNYHHEFAEDFLEAIKGGRETHMVWVNTFLAETWADDFEQLDWHPLMARVEDYAPDELPVEVMFLIGGMDLHPDRVEIHVLGWGAAEQVWCIEYRAIWGDFDLPEMQERVFDFMDRRYKHPILGDVKISAFGFDSGKQTKVKSVYKFAKKHRGRNVFAVKGFADPLGTIYNASDVTARFGIKLFNLNVDLLKCTIFDRLKIGSTEEEPVTEGPRFIHFPKQYDAKFFKQLCSERRVEQKRGNNTIYIWKKHKSNTRNEALDTTVYAFGVYEIIRQEGWIERKWAEVQAKLKESERVTGGTIESKILVKAEEKPKPVAKPKAARPPQVRRGGFFNPLGL